MTYQDADATFMIRAIQAHLLDQDHAINELLDKIAGLEASLIKAKQA